jgi:hypothetical protein
LTLFPRKNTLILGVGCLMLSGCVAALETRIDSSGAAATSISPGNAAIILPAKTKLSPEWELARQAVVTKLATKGITVADPAAYAIEVTLAARPANLALTGAVVTLAPASAAKAKKGCVTYDYRFNITFSRISDGSLLYKASASETHCKETLSALVPVLVDAALQDFGSPRGAYNVVRRKAHIGF